MKSVKKLFFLLVIIGCLQACEEREIKVPKQRGYFRIDLPERNYTKFKKSDFPYSFNIPSYSKVEKDTDLDEVVEDAHHLAFKHEVRADAINTKEFHYDEKNVHGLLFDIKGDAASVLQFCVTDSTTNFVRGALYFNVPPNKDSLAPVITFIREDIIEMISSFEWQK